MKIYEWELRNGISRTKEFERKGLAIHAVNCGLKCGHGCKYCSTGAMLRTHNAFNELGLSPFDNDYAIVDPKTPQRVALDARTKQTRGLIQLCTIVDAWSPEAQEYNLGRKCLEAILAEPNWTIRILTKNAAIKKDFDLIEKYKNRVLVGLSITATSDKSDVIKIIEPNASPIDERIEVLKEARARGFRTYAMFCPILPGIADSPSQINEFIKLSIDLGAEEVFAEDVNPRGRWLILTQDALKSKGYDYEAARVESIRIRKNWSLYVTQLIKNIQKSIRQQYDICKLRFLLYPSKLEPQDLAQIKQDDAGVIWLNKG